ncbi:MAG TPA: polysaccharide lyase [Nitrosospira sp.]|nr:polysaccharide lyase [Nitrosospira sp.]
MSVIGTWRLVMSIILSTYGLAHAGIIFDGRLDDHDFSGYRALEADGLLLTGVLAPNGIQTSLERVSDPAGSGRLVLKAAHIQGDLPTNGGYRSELNTFRDPVGSERWYSWGYYLPEAVKTAKNEVAIAQIHDTADVNESNARNPTLAVLVDGDRLELVNAFDYDRVTSPPGSPAVAGVDYERRELASWPLETNDWTYLTLHVKWAADNTGFLEFWKDGTLLFQEKNHINTFNDERGVWFKTGLYDWSSHPESISVYSTGVMIGDGRETLQSMMSMSSLVPEQSMSAVPEPSVYLVMVAGLMVIGCFTCAGRGRTGKVR